MRCNEHIPHWGKKIDCKCIVNMHTGQFYRLSAKMLWGNRMEIFTPFVFFVSKEHPDRYYMKGRFKGSRMVWLYGLQGLRNRIFDKIKIVG